MTTTIEPPRDQSLALDKSNQRIRAMFAGIARRYDLLNHVLSLNIDKRWRAKVIQRVPPRSEAPILDVCTGTGDLAIAYARASGPGTCVFGTDFCHEMLVEAKRKCRSIDRPIVLLEADTQRLPFEDDRFQIVSVAFGLRNVADVDRGLSEMIRVCQPGGRVAILEFSRPRLPLLRSLYLAYFRHILPAIGQRVSNSPDQAYHYLPESVMRFPDGPRMLALMQDMGLSETEQYPLTLGIASLYVGTKPLVSKGVP